MPKAIFLTTTKAGDLLPESVPYFPNRPGSYRQLIIRLCNSHCLKLAEHSTVLLQVSCFSVRAAISSAHSSASLCYLIQPSQGFSLIGSAFFCPQSAWFYSWVPSEDDWIWKLWCQGLTAAVLDRGIHLKFLQSEGLSVINEGTFLQASEVYTVLLKNWKKLNYTRVM